MKNVIVITGASSGFGALAARALARAGHIVYASMRETTGRATGPHRPGGIRPPSERQLNVVTGSSSVQCVRCE